MSIFELATISFLIALQPASAPEQGAQLYLRSDDDFTIEEFWQTYEIGEDRWFSLRVDSSTGSANRACFRIDGRETCSRIDEMLLESMVAGGWVENVQAHSITTIWFYMPDGSERSFHLYQDEIFEDPLAVECAAWGTRCSLSR